MNVWDDSNLLTHIHTLHTHVDMLTRAHSEKDLSIPVIFDVYKVIVKSNNEWTL